MSTCKCPACKNGQIDVLSGICDTCDYDAGADTFNGRGIVVDELPVFADDTPTDPYNTARFRRPVFRRP